MKPKLDFQKMQLGDVKETGADINYSNKKIGYEPKTSIKKVYQNSLIGIRNITIIHNSYSIYSLYHNNLYRF